MVGIEGNVKIQRSWIGNSISVEGADGRYRNQAWAGNTDMLNVESF